MQRGPSASSSSSPESIFTGVRFVLFGFDSVSEAQYRSELVCRGGTDVGRYDSSCSHVIVCGRVYDDPVCDAARQDGKALVSELWIDDSLDFGALADTTRVLYRPVKDLNGIPGCESLCICLTGYQRQERDDIMKMVSLMGARFSKPLIANQVTHLVCYKFEGEKYELAKKVNIKLVNHRWLEDCLKAWELLPTANYSRSGWELEILDAEARDSEEEAADPGKCTLKNKTVLLPSSTLGGSTQKFEAQQVTIPAQQSENPDVCLRDNSIFSTPHKKATSGNASDKYLNTKTREANYHKDTMGITPVDDDIIMRDAVNDGNESKLFDANSNMDGNLLPSSLRTVRQYSPLSAAADGKSGNQSYLMKTPSKLVSAGDPSTTLPYPKTSLEVSKSKIVETRENIVSTNIPSPTSGASAHHLEEHGSILPQRMKGAVSVGEQSPKLVLQDLNASVPHSPTRARYEQMEALTVLPRSSNVNGLACIDYCPDAAAVMSSNATLEAATSKLKGVSYKKRSDKQGQPALGIETSSAKVSHFDWNMTDILVDGPSHTVDVSMNIQDNSSALEPKTRNDDSPNRVLPVDNQQATVKLPTTKSSARNLGRTAVVRIVGETSAKEIALESSTGASERYEPCVKSEPNRNIPVSVNPNDPTGGDIAMSDIANASTEEPGEAFTLQQQEGVLSLDIGNSESLKLSSTASDVAYIENDVKEATVTHTKKVPKKNLGTKKRSTVNTRKDKVVASSDRITTSIQAAAEPDVSGKVKADRSCADIANIATKEPGETFTLHQKEGDLSADSQNLETRKLSSEASDVASKENDVKEATVANAKKVAPKKSLGTKKRSTVNMGKDKVVASSDRTTTSNLAATEQGIVGNVKADTPVGDIANIITEEPGETCTLQQQEGVSSLDSRNSETRKLLSADGDVACKENVAKEATVAHTKRVVPKKNLGTKKHSTVNMRKDKVVASSVGTTTLNLVAAEAGIVGKMKTDTPGGDNTNITIEEPGETFLLQQKEGVLSPNTRNSRKLSSAASVVACKENVTKEATVTRTKKVVSKKNVGTKSTVNTRKNKAVASSDTTTTSNQDATEPGIVGEAKADTLGDNVNITTEEIGKTSTLQQKVEVLSPDTRSSRRLSSAASVDACKENDIKAGAVAQTKKITKRNMGSKKPGAGKCRKDEVASLDKNAPSNQDGADPSMVGKSKAEHKHVSEISGLKKGTVNPVSVDDEVDAIVQNNVKVEPQSASRKRCRNTARNDKVDEAVQNNVKVEPQSASRKGNRNTARGMDTSMDPEKENKPRENGSSTVSAISHPKQMVVPKHGRKRIQDSKGTADENKKETQTDSRTRLEPARFMLSGHRLQRKELQAMVKNLKGRLCWDTHNWSYQATHLIIPDPLRRTEKFFAAAAAGRWILKTDYLTASVEAGRFLEEESFEWFKKGLTEDGAISLEAPRRWRLLRERTGHGALYGMRIIIYGDCIAPSLDTLKRVVKAGDGTILATAPPYDRFLKSGADYAIISPGMPHVDAWVQEFLRHEIPCIAADYLVEYVCKPGYSLERHVLFKTHAWADKSFANLLRRSDEVVASDATPLVDASEDIRCAVCGSSEMGEVMLLCGDEGGTAGCGIATHISCCVPPLEAVPDGDWFCPKCSTSKTSKAPLKSKRLKSSAKRK